MSMGLYDDLTARREAARKNHDTATLDSVQNVLAAVKNEQINRGQPLSDSDIQAVIARQVKQLKDALTDFVAANRSDLIDKTNTEIKLLESFLPVALSDDELESIAHEVLKGLGNVTERDLGRAVGAVMAQVKGRADGARVKTLVTKLVTGS